MKSKFSGSLFIALILAIGLGFWMITGEISIGGKTDEANTAKPIVEREAKSEGTLFKVRFVSIESSLRQEEVTIRGRTKADAIITVRAETNGVVEKRLFNKGQTINVGDLVCVLDKGTRESSLDEAKSVLTQAQTDYESSARLKKKGFATTNQLTQLQASVNSAQAKYEAAKLELERIEIRANASGIVQDPIAEVGDALNRGDACVTLIDVDPMLFTGQVPELLIGDFYIGMDANIQLVTGVKTTGKVRYIAAAADASTRTYQIEIELEKTNGIREGMTAESKISLKGENAFLVAPSWINLSDSGTIGVKTLNENDVVEFKPVKIASQGKEGFWISGLTNGDRIITLGQEYVRAGEAVEPTLDERISAIGTGAN